jgi:hypothetical protein
LNEKCAKCGRKCNDANGAPKRVGHECGDHGHT